MKSGQAPARLRLPDLIPNSFQGEGSVIVLAPEANLMSRFDNEPHTTSEFMIRCLQPDEWRLLKTLRLRALGCDPQSYWETVDEASARDDVYWITFASKVTTPQGSRMFIVEHSESVAGFVFGVKKDDDEYSVGGLWVDPLHRRKGLGSLLVQQVVTWARADSHAAVIRLWCHTGSALSFYQRNGFQSLDRFRTNDFDGRRIVEMEWRGT